MNPQRGRKAVLLCLLITMLTACGNVLDFRNAEISNGKIYADGANKPFSGKVTNIPMGKLPIGQLQPLVATLVNVTGDASYSGFFLANAIAAIVGGNGGPSVCDIHAKEGSLHGDVHCGINGTTVFEVTFKDGAMEGEARLLDPRGKGSVAAKSEFDAGKLNGGSTIYDSGTGKVLHTVSWKDGKADGAEKRWNRDGTLVFEGTIVAGKYDGKAVRYDDKGELALTTIYKAGVAERNIRPGRSDLENCMMDWEAALQVHWGGSATVGDGLRQQWREACSQGRQWNSPRPAEQPQATAQDGAACVDAWIAAYRKEQGQEAAVKHDQVSEWEEWCKQGRKPS